MAQMSVQEMDMKIRVMEDILLFMAQNLRMKAVITNGLLGPDGKPSGKVFDGSMLEFYRMSKQMDVINEAQEAELRDENRNEKASVASNG